MSTTLPAATDSSAITRGVTVLHVISGLYYGGGQRVVVDLLRELPSATGAACRLCTLGNGSPLDALADISIAYDGRYNSPTTLLRTARAMRRVVRQQQVDVLHTHGVDADLIGSIAVRGSETRHVCHLHITPPADGQSSLKSRLRRRLFRWLTDRPQTRFIAVSEAVRQQMSGFYRLPIGRIETIRNGIDPSEFTEKIRTTGPDTGRSVVIGTAGRLEPMKGFEHLIDATRLLKQQGLNFELRIAGSGKLRDRLETRARDCGVADVVRFCGQVSDMPEFYRDIDLFVLPSVSTEGLPLVVLEAMATGLPVIATRLAGSPEVIDAEVTGLLPPPGDSEALAAALARLLNDRELRERFGRNGAAHVRAKFTVGRVAREIAVVYDGLLSGSGRAGR